MRWCYSISTRGPINRRKCLSSVYLSPCSKGSHEAPSILSSSSDVSRTSESQPRTLVRLITVHHEGHSSGVFADARRCMGVFARGHQGVARGTFFFPNPTLLCPVLANMARTMYQSIHYTPYNCTLSIMHPLTPPIIPFIHLAVFRRRCHL